MLVPALSRLRPYVAGRGFGEISRRYGIPATQIVKLGSNENPYGPSPNVADALAAISPERYPEPEGLLEGLSAYTGFPEEMIVIGAGMDGVMDTLTRIFWRGGTGHSSPRQPSVTMRSSPSWPEQTRYSSRGGRALRPPQQCRRMRRWPSSAPPTTPQAM